MKEKTVYIVIILLVAGITAVVLGERANMLIIFRILATLILIFVILLRFSARRSFLTNRLIQAVLIFAVSFFIMSLVVNTGGFFSPLFILIHISAIALAFLFSFRIAIAFLAASLLAISASLFIRIKSGSTSFDLPVLVIQLLSIAGVAPFSAFIAKRYHLKGKFADYLSQKLFFQKNEENLILENIEEGVVTLGRDRSIIGINKTAEDLTGFKSENAIRRNFFETFKFFDRDKSEIGEDQFPIQELLKKQSSFRESTLLLKKANGELLSVDFKLSSILSIHGKIEGFLFVFGEKKEEIKEGRTHAVLEETFKNFLKLIGDINSNVDSLEANLKEETNGRFSDLQKESKRMMHAYNSMVTLYDLGTGEIPGLLSDFDVGETVREIFNQTADLASQYQVNRTGGNPYSPPMPIKTNKVIFTNSIEKLVELGIFIASKSEKKTLNISAGSSKENIFIFIKATCDKEFSSQINDDIFKPFFGRLGGNLTLSEASGLEGYLAQFLLKEKEVKGEIKAEVLLDEIFGPQILFKVTLPFVPVY